jgi:hypothetical protein
LGFEFRIFLIRKDMAKVITETPPISRLKICFPDFPKFFNDVLIYRPQDLILDLGVPGKKKNPNPKKKCLKPQPIILNPNPNFYKNLKF